MILESIVTTLDPAGEINLAPMGPWIGNPDALETETSANGEDPGFVLRPFEGSRTLANLTATRRATIHVTDDVSLFARAATGRLDQTASLVRRTSDGGFAVLRRCHRWFCIEVERICETPPRFEMPCRVVDSGIGTPFFGFNRGKHAVIEAAILATRTHLLPAAEIRRQIEWLRPLVSKTAHPRDAAVFARLAEEIETRIASTVASPNE